MNEDEIEDFIHEVYGFGDEDATNEKAPEKVKLCAFCEKGRVNMAFDYCKACDTQFKEWYGATWYTSNWAQEIILSSRQWAYTENKEGARSLTKAAIKEATAHRYGVENTDSPQHQQMITLDAAYNLGIWYSDNNPKIPVNELGQFIAKPKEEYDMLDALIANNPGFGAKRLHKMLNTNADKELMSLSTIARRIRKLK